MKLALIHNGIVQSESSEADAALNGADGKPLFDIRDVSSVDGIEPGWIVNSNGTFSAPPTPPPAPTPASISVTSAQAKIQLRRAGIRDKVDAAIQAADGEVQDWFTDARVWERDNPHVIDIGAGLGLKPADIDALFEAAAQIAV
jgi:hypothetical protein